MILIDPRTGSKSLVDHIPPALCQLSKDNLDGDFEFAACGPGGVIMPVGGEYKTISDCLTSMTDGRLNGTQITRMLRTYSRVYLLIEGETRTSSAGILETRQWDRQAKKYLWAPARGRKGEGWTAQEFYGRLASLEEFGGVRIHRTGTSYPPEDVKQSARWIVNLYHYWQKDYESHSSYKAWDRSGEAAKPMNLLTSTGDLPLVQRWAEKLPGIGEDKSKYVALHFRSAGAMARATDREWEKVEFVERIKTGKNAGQLRRKRMSTEKARAIVDAINEEIK
jgi:ERCC4-type nuclease